MHPRHLRSFAATPRRRPPALAPPAIALLLFLAAPDAAAHEVVDPVCGMKVDPEKVPWKEAFAGETYYFCQEADLDAFRRDPERYAGVLTLSARGRLGEYRVQVKPKPPRAGEAVRLSLSLPDSAPAGLPVEALVFHLDEERREVRRDRQVFAARSESAARVMNRYFDRGGACRLWVRVRLPEGGEDGVGFAFPVAPPAPESLAPAAATGPLSMGEQHDLMKRVGRDWEAARLALDASPPDRRAARERIDAVRRDLARVPQFELHHFEGSEEEHAALASDAQRPLERLRRAVEAGRDGDARALWRDVDANHCTKCHLKFRWGIVDDLSRFPDLTRGPE